MDPYQAGCPRRPHYLLARLLEVAPVRPSCSRLQEQRHRTVMQRVGQYPSQASTRAPVRAPMNSFKGRRPASVSRREGSLLSTATTSATASSTLARSDMPAGWSECSLGAEGTSGRARWVDVRLHTSSLSARRRFCAGEDGCRWPLAADPPALVPPSRLHLPSPAASSSSPARIV
eukprot:scaffold568_cov376-Prasinococcus_capsulatus_cf.AAC.5